MPQYDLWEVEEGKPDRYLGHAHDDDIAFDILTAMQKTFANPTGKSIAIMGTNDKNPDALAPDSIQTAAGDTKVKYYAQRRN